MLNAFRTLTALLFTRLRLGPRILQVRAWAWLCGRTDDPVEKARCLEAILDLDPEIEWAKMALRLVRSRTVR